MTVGLVIVSHSGKIAEGVVDLAGQMAGDVRIVAAGGTEDDGIGTSFSKTLEAIAEADSGVGVVLLCDLGSAILTAETARDFVEEAARARVVIADAPLVEGAVAAAVAAQVGESLAGVEAAARSAQTATATPTGAGESRSDAASPSTALTGSNGGVEGQGERAAVRLRNPAGLHARPAADFVRLASSFDSAVTVNGVSARSLLGIMALGLDRGAIIDLEASGPDARAALDALVALVESGFGE